MSVYTWLVVLILLAAVLMHGNVNNNKKFIFLAFLMLFFVMGFRDIQVVGNDATTSYQLYYNRMGPAEWSEITDKNQEDVNINFLYFLKMGYLITNGDYQLFTVLFAAFVMFSYARFIGKYSPSPLLSILCFLGLMYYMMLHDVLKQATAMTILLYAFDGIIEKRPIKFVLLTLFAASFHFPALVFLPAYWIGRMKVGRNYIILLAALLLITYIFRDQLLHIMLDAYKGDDAGASMDGIKFLRNKTVIMIAIVALATIIRPPRGDDVVYNALLMFAGIAIVFQTFCGYNNIFERLADYYFHTSIVFIPLVFEKNMNGDGHGNLAAAKTAVPIIIGAFSIWRFLAYVNSTYPFSEFRFFWQ